MNYHVLRSKGSQAGFPDRVLVRERIVYAELKRELTGKLSEDRNRQPTDEQRKWLDALVRAGGEVYLWRPSDLEEVARILAKRWIFFPYGSSGELATPALASADVVWWQPGSLWLPGVGRADEVAG